MNQVLPPRRSPSGRAKRATCSLCGKEFAVRHLVPARALRPSLNESIAMRHEGVWTDVSSACKACLGTERLEYLRTRLAHETGQLSAVEEDVARKASLHQTLAADIERQFEIQATTGQRIADRVAAVGGSWPFVVTFLLVLVTWALVNTFLLRAEAFDPFPYILLNLVLSCLAAIQAPVIMMSQNRLAARDRMQADHDFRINLKAELEIASLHEKVDHLLHTQWQHLVELQEIQLELLNELVSEKK